MNRRRFLGWTGAAGMAALAGCPESTDEPTPGEDAGPREDREVPPAARPVTRAEFDRVVDAAEAGADDAGEEPVDDLLREQAAADEGTLVVFPEGRYRIGGVELEDVGEFGMAAAEGATPTLVPAGPSGEVGDALLRVLSADGFLFEGFELDFRREGFGSKLHLTTTGGLSVRNVRVRGRYPREASGFHVAVEDEAAAGLLENVAAPGGGRQGGSSVGVFVDRRHAGNLAVRNCFFQNFPDNGLYASAPGGDGDLRGYGGVVRVLGGLYRNNNISNVRLGGPGAVARGVTVVVDDVPPHGDLNARGILLRNGADHRIENCRILVGEDAGYGLGAVVFSQDAGRAHVRNTYIEVDRDELPAIHAPAPAEAAPSPTGPVFEDVSIRGSAGAGVTAELIGRHNTEFRNCRVVQSGPDRDGIRFERSEDCLLARSTIDVTGDPVQNRGSSVNRRNVKVRR